MRRGLAAVFLSLAAPVVAGDFSLGMPLACEMNETCFIQQYVDRDPGTGFSDFTCGPLSYDGHKGTDFALPSLQAMTVGVDVMAAADGVVMGVRNGEPDNGIAGMTEGRDCGNGVLLRHPNGWETQYCHLKVGSITVIPGAQVARGEKLGEVGFSGRTEFPHLHLSVRRNDAVVDPFQPGTKTGCGTDAAQTLWEDEIAYRPGGIISIGISTDVPSYDRVKAGTAGVNTLDGDAPALVLFAYAFGGRVDDTLALVLNGPAGQIVAQEIALDRQQAQFFRALGRKRPDAGWPAGQYAGSATLIRNGAAIETRGLRFTID